MGNSQVHVGSGMPAAEVELEGGKIMDRPGQYGTSDGNRVRK